LVRDYLAEVPSKGRRAGRSGSVSSLNKRLGF
jgi:hypothetical protein